RMRAIVPAAAKFIHMIIRACHYQRVLEIGTSHGYSTLWWASAAQAIGGHVDTIEIAPERAAAARAKLQRAGGQAMVRSYEADPRAVLPTLNEPYDLIFLDSEKDDYQSFLDLIKPQTKIGGLIMADNVLSHADQLDGYIRKVQRTAGLFSTTVNVGR